jgi:hypothetical protein
MLGRRINCAHCNFLTGLFFEGTPSVHKLVFSFSAQPDSRTTSDTQSTVDMIAVAADTSDWSRIDTAMRQQLIMVAASSAAHGFGTECAVTFPEGDGGQNEREFKRAVKDLIDDLSKEDSVWGSSLGPSEAKATHVPGQPWHLDPDLVGQLSGDCSLTPENPNILCSLPLGASNMGPQLAMCDFGNDGFMPWLVRLDKSFPRHLPLASGPFLAGEEMKRGDVFWTWANCVHRGIRLSVHQNEPRKGTPSKSRSQNKRKHNS